MIKMSEQEKPVDILLSGEFTVRLENDASTWHYLSFAVNQWYIGSRAL